MSTPPSNTGSSSHPAFESMGQMLGSLDAFKQAWQSMQATSPFKPTLDPDELDKRISELRSVEQWLNLNLNLLRNTIQAMEIQRGTLQALNSLSASLAAGATASPGNAPSAPAAASAPPAPAGSGMGIPGFFPMPGLNSASTPGSNPLDATAQMSQAWWQLMQQQVGHLAGLAHQPWPASPPPATPPGSGGSPADGDTPATPQPATPRPPASQQQAGPVKSRPAAAPTEASATPPAAGQSKTP